MKTSEKVYWLIGLLCVGVLFGGLGALGRNCEIKKLEKRVKKIEKVHNPCVLNFLKLNCRTKDHRERMEKLLREKRMSDRDLLGGIENWMRKDLAQSCDPLPDCDELDKMWLKGKTKCVHCGRWIKKGKPCPYQEKEDL